MSWCHPAAQTHHLPSGWRGFIRTASRSSYKSGLLCVSPENKHAESAQPHMQTQWHENVQSLSWVALNSFVLFLFFYHHNTSMRAQKQQSLKKPTVTCLPEVWSRCPFQSEAGQVHSSIDQQEENGHDAGNGVELSRKQHQLLRQGPREEKRRALRISGKVFFKVIFYHLSVIVTVPIIKVKVSCHTHTHKSWWVKCLLSIWPIPRESSELWTQLCSGTIWC